MGYEGILFMDIEIYYIRGYEGIIFMDIEIYFMKVGYKWVEMDGVSNQIYL